MKTIKQAAKEYANKNHFRFINNIEREVDIKAFEAGVNFAQEWISPQKEMPPVGKLVQVKVKWRDDNDISYDHDKRYKDETYDDFEINQMVGLEVIGWRPIERE